MNIMQFCQKIPKMHKIIFISAITAAVILINIYSNITGFAVLIGMQLYYLPIILSNSFYPKKGLIFSTFLIAVAIIIPFGFEYDPVLLSSVIIASLIMGGVSVIVSFISNEMKKNQYKFKNLFENNPNPLIAFDEKGTIIDINSQFESETGYNSSSLIGKTIEESRIFAEEYLPEFTRKFGEFCKGGKVKSFLVDIKAKNKTNDIKKCIVTFICFEKTEQTEFTNLKIASISDITSQIAVSEKLKESEKRYRQLANLLPQTIAETDRNMNITFINEKGLETFKISKNKDISEINILDHLISDNHIKAKKLLDELAAGSINEASSEFTGVKTDGTRFPIIVYSNLIRENGDITGIRIAVIDMTQLKETEKALSETENKLTKLIQNFSGIAYRSRLDENMSIDFLSDGFYEMTGYKESDIRDNFPINLKSIVHPDDFEDFKQTILKTLNNKINHFEARYRILTAKGETRWVWNQGKTVKDDNGRIIAVEGIISDITGRVKAEKALEETERKNKDQIVKSLKEKETLLKEIHHRVKNNLQIIASILKLSDMQTENPELHEVLLDCRNRVFSMSMIHEKLYRSESLAKISIRDYINSLQLHLLDEYSGEYSENIKMICDCDENIVLDIDTAIPCGLIINEILTNSLKYAFDKEGGEIKIEFYENEDDSAYILSVGDSGRGFPKDYDYENSDSLGMQLIYNLVAQLEGTIDIESEKGTSYTITIPKGKQKSVKL